jgi:hypothetical protein
MAPRRPVPTGRQRVRRGRDPPRQEPTATARSICCAAGSVPASAQRTSAEHTTTPDRRTAELAVTGPPDVPHSARPQETAGRSCAPELTRSHNPGMPPRPPYCTRRCVSPRDSRPATAPTRPRWTVTAGFPDKATSLPRRRTVDHTKIGPGHFQATSRGPIEASVVTQRARLTESEPEPVLMNNAKRGTGERVTGPLGKHAGARGIGVRRPSAGTSSCRRALSSRTPTRQLPIGGCPPARRKGPQTRALFYNFRRSGG